MAIPRVAFLMSVFFSLILVYEDHLGDAPYVALLLGFLLSGIFIIGEASIGRIRIRTNFTRRSLAILALVTLVIGSWFYGVFVGLLNGVRHEFVFRNFIGLLVYFVLLMFFILEPRVKSLVVLTIFAGLIQLLFALGSFDINSFSNLHQNATSISDSRSSYSTGYLVIFPLCSACAGVAIFDKNGHGFLTRIALFSVFVVCALAITIVTASKGFILALILLIRFIYIRLIFWRGGRLAAALLFLVATIAGSTFLSDSHFLDTLLHSYSLEEPGNEIRSEQARELLSDLSPVGNGLGAGVSSGYARDENGFGFELTYLNLLHKLGVFVVPIFALYAITFISVLLKAWHNPNKVPPMLALGCLGYLIVGVGNPVLLAPSCVVMHCIAMYLCVSKDGA